MASSKKSASAKNVKKGPRHETRPGSTRSAEAEALFLVELNRALPTAAFDELRSDPQELDVEQWADRWHVRAPCLIEQAKEWAQSEHRLRIAGEPPTTFRFGESRTGTDLPVAWRAELERLNQKPIEFAWLAADTDTIASESEVGKQVDSLTRDHALQVIREARADRLATDAVLAPIATDPLRESRDHFVQRAIEHWDARASRAKLFGATPAITATSLAKHIGWLVRHVVRGQTISAIARADGVSRQAVSAAIASARRLVRVTSVSGTRQPQRTS